MDIRLSHKPIQRKAQLVRILIVTLISLLTLFGLFAIKYNKRGRQRFLFSKRYLAYAMLVTAFFTSIYVNQMYLDYTRSRLNLRDAVKLYSYMNITVAIINFFTQMLMSKQAAKMMSNVPLFRMIKELQIDSSMIRNSVILSLIKVLGFPLVIEVALVLQQRMIEPELHWAWSLYKLFPMIISNFLNNCYFGAMIIAKNIMETLNERLKKQVQQVNLMQHKMQKKLHSKYYGVQRYCTHADDLDNLAKKYKTVCDEATKYMALMSLSIVLSLICNLLGITVGFFNQYYAIAESAIGKKRYDAFGALINLVFLIISILEIGLLTYVSNAILIAAQTTGIVLQEIKLELADWRFRQSVHTFSLLVVTIKYTIKPMGLLEIDITLMSKVVSTVASFLLILVQADLSQRFKYT